MSPPSPPPATRSCQPPLPPSWSQWRRPELRANGGPPHSPYSKASRSFDSRWYDPLHHLHWHCQRHSHHHYYALMRIYNMRIFTILCSHFTVFFKWFPQCFWAKNLRTLFSNITILLVYVLTTSFNYFNSVNFDNSFVKVDICHLSFVILGDGAKYYIPPRASPVLPWRSQSEAWIRIVANSKHLVVAVFNMLPWLLNSSKSENHSEILIFSSTPFNSFLLMIPPLQFHADPNCRKSWCSPPIFSMGRMNGWGG